MVNEWYICLDNMSPRGQEQGFHALNGLWCLLAIWGAIWGLLAGLRRASNGFLNTAFRRERFGYLKRFGTVSVQVLGVALRGFPLAEKSLPTEPLRAHVEGSVPPTEAARDARSRRSWWPFYYPLV